MARSKTFQVKDNRIYFKCYACDAKRYLPVPPNVRKRSVRCHRCGTLSSCVLNRREQARQFQSGKAAMIFMDGKEVEIALHDISRGGVGFDVFVGAIRTISLRQEVQFKCGWNPRLFDQGRYIIKSIKGYRIGVQNKRR